MNKKKVKVLFVCLGNICRSPTAQGVFEHLVNEAGLHERIDIDSAGTSDYHAGRMPDARSMSAALKRKYDLSRQRARQVRFDDFYDYDYILAMDKANLTDLKEIAPKEFYGKIHLMLDFGNSSIKEVPDPYHGGEKGFEHVLDLLEDACAGLLEDIKAELGR